MAEEATTIKEVVASEVAEEDSTLLVQATNQNNVINSKMRTV